MIVDRISMEQATLVRLATDLARERVKARTSIVSVYLIGSVAAGERPLGDATDLDLVLIDGDPPERQREVVPLTDSLVADLHTHTREAYRNPKALRVDPWRGPAMCEPIFLYDPTHFFELAQASARGQFHRPDHVIARARAFLDLARTQLRVDSFKPGVAPRAPVSVEAFCLALLNAANAAITLTGFPGAGRRLLLKLESASTRLGGTNLYDAFNGVFGVQTVSADEARRWVAEWAATYRAAQAEAIEALHPARLPIYERGFAAQIQSDRAVDMLWLLLLTWQGALRQLPTANPAAAGYADFLARLGMADAAGFKNKVGAALDFARLCEQRVEAWGSRNGA